MGSGCVNAWLLERLRRGTFSRAAFDGGTHERPDAFLYGKNILYYGPGENTRFMEGGLRGLYMLAWISTRNTNSLKVTLIIGKHQDKYFTCDELRLSQNQQGSLTALTTYIFGSDVHTNTDSWWLGKAIWALRIFWIPEAKQSTPAVLRSVQVQH